MLRELILFNQEQRIDLISNEIHALAEFQIEQNDDAAGLSFDIADLVDEDLLPVLYGSSKLSSPAFPHVID